MNDHRRDLPKSAPTIRTVPRHLAATPQIQPGFRDGILNGALAFQLPALRYAKAPDLRVQTQTPLLAFPGRVELFESVRNALRLRLGIAHRTVMSE